MLLGDFNRTIGEGPDSMQKIINDHGLIDVLKSNHSPCRFPITYARGHQCLDYVFATPRVENSVVKAGYEAFNARYPTDHRAYYVNFSTELLFGI